MVNTMSANVRATQGAKASATTVLTVLNRNNSVPDVKSYTQASRAH